MQQLLERKGIDSELVYIKSEGDTNTVTPLYEMGVEGIFTKALDIALLSETVDLAVHSMKDVPIGLAEGLQQAAVLERASFKDILVYKGDTGFMNNNQVAIIASSSVRRIAQWLHRFPSHTMVTIRGNVNTRLQKLEMNEWDGAIFAGAGLERINLRPENSIDLDWMLPAPAQGAIMLVCRADDLTTYQNVRSLNHRDTEICTRVERAFLKTLHGGCSSPVSALAEIESGKLLFKGSIASHDGSLFQRIEDSGPADETADIGHNAALQLINMDLQWIKDLLKKNGHGQD